MKSPNYFDQPKNPERNLIQQIIATVDDELENPQKYNAADTLKPFSTIKIPNSVRTAITEVKDRLGIKEIRGRKEEKLNTLEIVGDQLLPEDTYRSGGHFKLIYVVKNGKAVLGNTEKSEALFPKKLSPTSLNAVTRGLIRRKSFNILSSALIENGNLSEEQISAIVARWENKHGVTSEYSKDLQKFLALHTILANDNASESALDDVNEYLGNVYARESLASKKSGARDPKNWRVACALSILENAISQENQIDESKAATIFSRYNIKENDQLKVRRLIKKLQKPIQSGATMIANIREVNARIVGRLEVMNYITERTNELDQSQYQTRLSRARRVVGEVVLMMTLGLSVEEPEMNIVRNLSDDEVAGFIHRTFEEN